MLEWLTELRDTFTYIYLFIIKDIIKDTDKQPDEEVHRVRSGRVPSTGASVPMKTELGCATLRACGWFTNPQALQTPSF